MNYTNTQRIFRSPFYLRKPHFFPACGAKVTASKQSKIINAASEEAREYELDGMIGNVKVTWDEFLCSRCGRYTTIDEMKRHEGSK